LTCGLILEETGLFLRVSSGNSKPFNPSSSRDSNIPKIKGDSSIDVDIDREWSEERIRVDEKIDMEIPTDIDLTAKKRVGQEEAAI
jgi:hypothetical protein